MADTAEVVAVVADAGSTASPWLIYGGVVFLFALRCLIYLCFIFGFLTLIVEGYDFLRHSIVLRTVRGPRGAVTKRLVYAPETGEPDPVNLADRGAGVVALGLTLILLVLEGAILDKSLGMTVFLVFLSSVGWTLFLLLLTTRVFLTTGRYGGLGRWFGPVFDGSGSIGIQTVLVAVGIFSFVLLCSVVCILLLS